MSRRRPPSLTAHEALSGLVFTPGMRESLDELAKFGRTQLESATVLENVLAREIQVSQEAGQIYLDMWKRSGVTAACGTYSGWGLSTAFEETIRKIANAQAIISALNSSMILVRSASDIEQAHAENKYGVIIDFQNTHPLADDLSRVDLFYGLGLRMVQLNYNLQDLVGDGCTETYQGGLTYFGRELVAMLNDRRILVDVSHSSEQVGWDTMEMSSAPVIVSHSSSKAVAYHDRGKSDEFARAIAEQGGYFGIVAAP